jgi:hypothetical protein
LLLHVSVFDHHQGACTEPDWSFIYIKTFGEIMLFIMQLCGSMSCNMSCNMCRSDIYVYFNVNFNVFFKIKKWICWWVNSTFINMHCATIKKCGYMYVDLKISILPRIVFFWVMTSCNFVDPYQHFRATFCVYHLPWRWKQCVPQPLKLHVPWIRRM